MGDSGSLVIGLLLGWVLIELTQNVDGKRMPPVVALWLLAIPLIDTVAIMTRRIIRGRNPFQADREHIHHLLQVAGFSHAQTVAILLIFAALWAALGILAWHLDVPRSIMLLAFIALFLAHLWITFHAWRVAHYVGLARRWFSGGSSPGKAHVRTQTDPQTLQP